jgi:hypothetical protein
MPTAHVLSPSSTSDTLNRCPQHRRARLLILIPTPRPPTRALCLSTRPVAATMPNRLAAALALALALAATLCRATLAPEGDPRAGALALVPLNGGGGTLPDCAASNDALAQETATDEALRCFNEDGCTESCAERFLGGAMSDDGLASQVMFCNVEGAGPKCCARYMVPDGVKDPNSLLQVAMAYSASGRGADGTCLGVAPDSICFECATAVVNQRRLDCDAIYVPAVDEPFPGPVECSSWTVDFDATTSSGDGSAGSSGSASGVMDDSSAASPVPGEPASDPARSDPGETNGGGGVPVGAAVGGSVAGLVVLGAVVASLVWCILWRKKGEKETRDTIPENPPSHGDALSDMPSVSGASVSFAAQETQQQYNQPLYPTQYQHQNPQYQQPALQQSKHPRQNAQYPPLSVTYSPSPQVYAAANSSSQSSSADASQQNNAWQTIAQRQQSPTSPLSPGSTSPPPLPQDSPPPSSLPLPPPPPLPSPSHPSMPPPPASPRPPRPLPPPQQMSGTPAGGISNTYGSIVH